jgi:hypothetical protein
MKNILKMYEWLHKRVVSELMIPFDVKNIRMEEKRRGPSATIDGWTEMSIPEDLRVHTREDLWHLFRGFRFPDQFVSKGRNVFTGEEVFLFGMYGLSHAGNYSQYDVQELFGYHNAGIASKSFHCFLSFMVNNWGYLLTNNVDFWLPHLKDCATAISRKCLELGCYFPEEYFNIFAFIDNTMNSTCRPGGGPATDGTNADRNDPLIQRAWYNGWKKLHGMKWQTVDLPNGMNFHAWGPFSVRHPDLFSVRHSTTNEIIAGMQEGREMQYRIYGDSACIVLSSSHVCAPPAPPLWGLQSNQMPFDSKILPSQS